MWLTLLSWKSGICVLFHDAWMGHDSGGCYVTFEVRWEMIIALLICYEILLEHGHGTATKKFKLAHAGTSYQEVTCISSSQQTQLKSPPSQDQPWMALQLIQSTPLSPLPNPSLHAFTSEAQSSESRDELSLLWRSNFWCTNCEYNKVLVYATEVLV